MTERQAGIRAAVAHETGLALRNAVKLAFSLLSTLAVAFAVRFWMPRYLGPEIFGLLHFAESFATTALALTALGIDTYIGKEVATRFEHASEFFGGLIVVRALASLLAVGVAAAVLLAMGKGALTWHTVFIFMAAQAMFVLNGSLAAFLHAAGTVSELAVVNVVAKCLWGVGIVVGLLMGGGPRTVAFVFLVAESLKSPLLLRAARQNLRLRFRLDGAAILSVLVASVPFYLNSLAHRIYATIDVTMISWIANDKEVGWYGAAFNVTLIILLMLPILQAVVLPMGSRLARASVSAMDETMRAAIRVALIVTVPMALLLALNAPHVVPLLYSGSYAPAVGSLRILAPMLPLSYVCTMAALHLVNLGRIWTVARIAVLAMVVNPVLNAYFIPLACRFKQAGLAGHAAAGTSVGTEVLIATLLFLALGPAGFDGRLVRLLLRMLSVCVAVGGMHVALSDWGIWRIPAELVLYLGMGYLVGAVPLKELLTPVRAALARRRDGAATASNDGA